MLGEDEDEPTLGETMNRDLGLDPGFTLDRSDLDLVEEAREEQDETVEESERQDRPKK